MSKDQEPLLKEIEKKKLLDTAEIIHKIFEEISTKRKKSIWEILNSKLIILIAGAIISGFLVFQYQKQFENSAEKVKARYDLSKEIIDEIFLYSGEILSKAKIIVNLHSEAITDELQIISANKAYNNAYDIFISNFLKIRFKLKIIFKNDNINKWWEGIQNRIDELDKLLNLLLEFPTNKISETHSERIGLSEEKIKEINSELSLVYDFVFQAFE
jgi:hypothetical protein